MKVTPRLLAAASIVTMAALAACGGGGGGGGGTIPSGGGGGGGSTPIPTLTPSPTPTPTATPTISPNSSLVCKTSGAPQSIAQTTQSFAQTPMEFNRPRLVPHADTQPIYAPGVIEVVYRSATLAANRAAAARLTESARGHVQGEIDAGAIGDNVQIVSVEPGTEDQAIAQFRSNPMVKAVSRDTVRQLFSTTPHLLNDPYYLGFPSTVGPPLYETNASTSRGQWDMHVICAANAWGYGDANTTGSTFAGALGGNANGVKLAIIDTGADLTHPDLAGRAVFTESDLPTGTNSDVHDNDGHGTNVAGIAAASGGNGFGFAGVAYNVPLMIFKVFPDPSTCGTGGCTARGSDVGLAVQHAVANGAKVISLSLGANGPDTAEETAVLNAIASGVVVVAASGNGDSSGVGQPTLSYPAADAGVIAVGASGLDDTGSTELVSPYSNWDATNPIWGLVAPGGRGTNSSDILDFVYGLYTSTASDSASFCTVDFASAPNDCRRGFAGTSQATPHVAGAVALMRAVNPALLPATVKTLLCASSRDIGGGIKQGCGRLDVYRAMARAVNDLNP